MEQAQNPTKSRQFGPTCEEGRRVKYIYPYGEAVYLDIYAAVIKNFDKAMPREEAEQYYPQFSDEEGEWQMVKK